MFARLGGDEFVLLLSNVNSEKITSIIETIEEKISKPYSYLNENIVCSATIGCSIYPDNASNKTDLLKYADNEMYINKHGHN